jgi:hypothetical protein
LGIAPQQLNAILGSRHIVDTSQSPLEALEGFTTDPRRHYAEELMGKLSKFTVGAHATFVPYSKIPSLEYNRVFGMKKLFANLHKFSIFLN